MSRIKKSAKAYVERYGISVIELLPNDKRPAKAWSEYQGRLPNAGEIDAWNDKANVGLVTGKQSRIAVVDCESRKDADWFWAERGQTTTVVRTRRGYHLYFKWIDGVGNAAKVKDEHGQTRYDIRGEGGYVVAPPSAIDTAEYEYQFGLRLIEPEALPEFRPEWMPKIYGTNGHTNEHKVITDGVAYISKIRAVSGQGGHNDTFRAANVLRDSGMPESDALAALVEWNVTNAEPPWSTAELLHKIKDAYRK